MSNRVTSAIASRKARENILRLLFPKEDQHLTTAVNAGTNLQRRRRMVDASSLSKDNGNTTANNTNNKTKSHTNNNRQKRHSYSQLRTVYLQKVHAMHPDKIAHQSDKQLQSTGNNNNNGSTSNTTNNDTTATTTTKDDAHLQFIELKNAWEEYHASVRSIAKHHRNNVNEGNNNNNNNINSSNIKQYSDEDDDFWEEEEENDFTMFGVGCSFDDSPEERDLRHEIMEQASRGWFSSGSLVYSSSSLGGRMEQQRYGRDNTDGEGTSRKKLDVHAASDLRQCAADADDHTDAKSVLRPRVKLSDDDMFVRGDPSAEENHNSPQRKYLVQNVEKFRRRR
mmetsp:Transcript_40435/g.87326  ORF Transcript_40435/g.87326 Transcript_40435/m.87326 type:complete len:338 (-) Transcript_40435:445-1458(-)